MRVSYQLLFWSLRKKIIPVENLSFEDKVYWIKFIHELDHICFKALEQRAICCGYDWPDTKTICTGICKNCQTCNEINIGKTVFNNLSSHKRGFPLDSIHMDIAGPFHLSSKNNNSILVVVGAFTSFIWLFPLYTLSL